MAVPQIHVYDPNSKRIRVVENAKSLTWKRRWRGFGEWVLQINAHLPNANYFIEDGFIGFYRGGQYRFGLIEFPKLTTGSKPDEDIWEFRGRDANAILNRRILQNYQDLGTEFDEQDAVTREAACRHYVDVEAINSFIPANNIPNLSLEADGGRGGTLSAPYKGRNQYLDETISELCAAGTPDPLGWDVIYTPVDDSSADPGDLTFRIRSSRDKTTVKLSTTFQSIRGSEYQHNLMNYRNVGVVGGAGEGTTRTFRTVDDGTSPTGISRRVVFIDASAYSTNDEIDQYGATRLMDYAGETSITPEYNELGPFRYITDFDLGDKVTAKIQIRDVETLTVHEVVEAISTIVMVDEEYTESGERVKLTLGSEKPDLVDVVRRDRKQYLQTIRR